MNILIIPSWYNTPEDPISGIFFKEQALALQSFIPKTDKIFIVFVESFSIFNLKIYIRRKRVSIGIEDGIPTLRTKFLRFPKMHKLNCIIGAKKLSKAVKIAEKKWNLKFDLVHIHSAIEAGIWYNMSKLPIPYIITEHRSNFSRNLITQTQGKLLPDVFNNAKRIISVGEGLAKQIRRYTNKEIQIIYNIVYDKKKKSCNTNQNVNKKFSFFSLGINARVKGFDILLKAFAKFIESGKEGCLQIAGLNQSQKEWLKSLQISETVMRNVELIDKISHEQVFDYLENCDCFVLVSRHETFGVVFAEAMYCGKPVIASATGGPDSFINKKNGILVSVENIDETAAALDYVLNNYRQYDSEYIKGFAKENFAPDVICKQLYDVYREVINK